VADLADFSIAGEHLRQSGLVHKPRAADSPADSALSAPAAQRAGGNAGVAGGHSHGGAVRAGERAEVPQRGSLNRGFFQGISDLQTTDYRAVRPSVHGATELSKLPHPLIEIRIQLTGQRVFQDVV
jgi:hypothetical protein